MSFFSQNTNELKTVSERRKTINDEIAKIQIEKVAQREVKLIDIKILNRISFRK